MGKHKIKRTEEQQQAARQYVTAVLDEIIAEQDFDKLVKFVAQGTIVEASSESGTNNYVRIGLKGGLEKGVTPQGGHGC